MHGLNYDSAETLAKIYTLHKRVAIVGLGLLCLLVLAQFFWIFMFFVFSHGLVEGSRDAQAEIKKLEEQFQGFKTLDQLNAERPKIPKKFD